ncbi:MAG: PepSY domain-containing protein [Beijerinckiaceae bacterium]
MTFGMCSVAVQALMRHDGAVPRPLLFLSVAFSLALLGRAAPARAQAECLNSSATQEAVAEKRAVPPSQALRAARHHAPGETLRARLCHHNDQLVYWVTVLMRDGKVGRVLVDAADGHVVEMR